MLAGEVRRSKNEIGRSNFDLPTSFFELSPLLSEGSFSKNNGEFEC